MACYRDISLLAVELKNPYGYGRILRNDNGQPFGIIEEKDASAEQKKIKLINVIPELCVGCRLCELDCSCGRLGVFDVSR